MTTAWHQHAPYNNLCPVDDSCQPTAVGCGAIAAAQIMAYWRWPEGGVGATSYVWSDTHCNTGGFSCLTVDFNDVYDWDNISDD